MTLPAINEIPVPDYSNNFQEKFEKLYKCSEEIAFKSKSLYTAAQNLLLAELGLTDYTPTRESVSVKTFAESFGASGRLDAEYYQPKYEEVEKKIKSYAKGYKEFGNVVEYIFTGEYSEEYERKADDLRFYIRGPKG